MSCTNEQAVESSLMYRHSVYELLRRIFLWEFPLELFIEVVEMAKAGSSTEEFACRAEGVLRDYLKTLETNDLPDLYRGFHIAYTRLFVGPRHVLTPPYESVYRSPDKLLMQDETFEVRAVYALNGFQVAKAHSIPDDAIGIEMEFICALNKSCFDASRGKDYSRALALVKAQQEFCNRHLLKWISEFCGDIAEKSNSQFWQNVAAFTREFIQEEPAVLSSLLHTLTKLAEAQMNEATSS